MTRATTHKSAYSQASTADNDKNFHAQIQAGLRRAPRERAMAVRALWAAISKNLW